MHINRLIEEMENQVDTLESAASDFEYMHQPDKAKECLEKADWTKYWLDKVIEVRDDN